jgi:3-oxoacyl-[acyl-carrier-protein] synthase II
MAVGEGAAFVVLEPPDVARRRGASILATVEGYGLGTDAYHLTAPDPDGRGALAALRQALGAARTGPEDVDHVNAHGTATQANDLSECNALCALFGARVGEVPVASIKGAIGHCLGAAGAVEAVATVLSLLHQTVPPCVGFAKPDPQIPLRIPVRAQPWSLRRALSLSAAFGGNNAALLFGRAT